MINQKLLSLLLCVIFITEISAQDERIDTALQNNTAETSTSEVHTAQTPAEIVIDREQLQQFTLLMAWMKQQANENNMEVGTQEVVDAVEWKKICKQIGLDMSPTQFLMHMTQTNGDFTQYKIFCEQNKIPYTAPIELFNAYIDTVKKQNKNALKAIAIGIGIGAGTTTAATKWQALPSEQKQKITDQLKNEAKKTASKSINGGFKLLEIALKRYCIEDKTIYLPNGTPITSHHQLTSIAVQTTNSIVNEEVKAYLNKNQKRTVIQMTRDGSILLGNNIANVLIDNSPLPEDTVLLSFENGQYVKLSTNQFIGAVKGCTKDSLTQFCHTKLTNADKKLNFSAEFVGNSILINLLNEFIFDNALEVGRKYAPEQTQAITQLGWESAVKEYGTKFIAACIVTYGPEMVKNIVVTYGPEMVKNIVVTYGPEMVKNIVASYIGNCMPTL
ncbi:MAG: hypothetical protein WD055_02875 [Candidatus Dependentiae bacterium]